MIDTIIFDFGGVFSFRESLLEFAEHYSKKRNLNYKEFSKIMISNWDLARIDKIDSDLFFVELAEFSNTNLDIFKKDFINWFGFNDDMYEFVKTDLYGKYKLGILSNQIKSWLEPVLKKKEFYKYFDQIVTSYGEKIAKPDNRIYEIVLNKLDSQAENCVYIDDREKNLIPAQKIGFKTILFKNFKKFKVDLRKIIELK